MRAVNQALQAEAEQQRHDAEEDDDDAEDGNALALVPIQYQGGDQNYDSQPFYYVRPQLKLFVVPNSQADFGGLSQYTPASQVYDPSQPGSSHHNAPSNIIPQFGGSKSAGIQHLTLVPSSWRFYCRRLFWSTRYWDPKHRSHRRCRSHKNHRDDNQPESDFLQFVERTRVKDVALNGGINKAAEYTDSPEGKKTVNKPDC
nr:hypothetical protein Iba_chr06cCG1960 [Ipomoea batatas]